MADVANDKTILEEAQAAFTLAASTEQDNRVAWLDDLKFARLGEQWPAEIRKQREEDHRPCLTINRLKPVIRQVVNDGRQNRPAIKVHPADSAADVETAEIINGLIRNIEYSSRAPIAYDTGLDYAVTAGFGYWRVNTAYSNDDNFEQDIIIERISNPLSVYGDPHSISADSADWNTSFVTDMLIKSAFRQRFKGAEEVDWDELGYGQGKIAEGWCDGDGDEQRLMVAEYWRRDPVMREIVALSNGEIVDAAVMKQRQADPAFRQLTVTGTRKVQSHKVRQYLLSGAEVLETTDWLGRYIPIIPVWGEEVNVEGKRHLISLIRDAKDAQRNFNYSRSAVTEAVNLAPKTPFIGPVGAFDTDMSKWLTANTASHGFIEYDIVQGATPPQRQPFVGVPAGQLQEALNAADDIKAVTGLHDASLGARSNETSGRAILARQREGDVSTFHFLDNLSRAIEHTGRVVVDLIPHVYSGARILRVMGVDGTPETVRTGSPDEAKASAMALQAKVEGAQRIYALDLGKYDLTVETGPSFTTRREESAQQMMELLRVFPQAASVIGDLLVKNLDWENADEIAKRLHAMLPPQLRGGDPQAAQIKQQAQQVIQQLQATIGQLTGKLRDAESEKMLDQMKLQIDAFKAQTDRMEAQADITSKVTQGVPLSVMGPPPGF